MSTIGVQNPATTAPHRSPPYYIPVSSSSENKALGQMAGGSEIVFVLSDCYASFIIDNADSSHGPLFLGTAFNVLLYGISITQTYLYLTSTKE